MSTTDKKHATRSCFVAMPFGGAWDDYYSRIYAPAIQEAGLVAMRADDVFGAGSILQDIVALLSNATMTLVDISENNRNVHYELGLAHALGKPTLLIAPRSTPLFFDIGQERMLTYDKDNAFWGTELKNHLVRAIRETLEQPETAIPTAFIHMKPSNIASDEVVVRLRRIEEQLAGIARGMDAGRRELKSGLTGKMNSLADAEEEARRLAQHMAPEEVASRLKLLGYPPMMVESALALALAAKKHGTPG